MNWTERGIALAVGIIHPVFFTKLAKYVIDYQTINSMCNDIPYEMEPASKYAQCTQNRQTAMNNVELKLHISLLIIAIISLIIAVVIRQPTPKVGIGLGGLLLLIWTLSAYWDNYAELVRLTLLGIVFAIVLYLSVKIYNTGSLVDALSIKM